MLNLRKFKFYDELSQETFCFTSELFFNDIKVGSCKNDGNGGNTYFYYENKNCQEFNEYYKTFESQYLFENKIDELVLPLVIREDIQPLCRQNPKILYFFKTDSDVLKTIEYKHNVRDLYKKYKTDIDKKIKEKTDEGWFLANKL